MPNERKIVMYKEHIIQFGVAIDEDVIMERVYKSAEKTIVEDLKKEFNNILYQHSTWGNKQGLSAWVAEQFSEFLTQHQDAIIEMAAATLADKMSRMKVVKEAAGDVARGS